MAGIVELLGKTDIFPTIIEVGDKLHQFSGKIKTEHTGSYMMPPDISLDEARRIQNAMDLKGM